MVGVFIEACVLICTHCLKRKKKEKNIACKVFVHINRLVVFKFIQFCIVLSSTINILIGQSEPLPLVMVGVFIEAGSPFLAEMLQKVAELDYPKERVHFFLHNQVSFYHYFFFYNLLLDDKVKIARKPYVPPQPGDHSHLLVYLGVQKMGNR